MVYPIVPDKFDQIKEMVAKAADECDMVILNAGSSAGREDFSARVIRELGGAVPWHRHQAPASLPFLGRRGEKVILECPVISVSGIIVIEHLLKPLIDHWLKASAATDTYVNATLTRPVVSGLKYQEFVRVRMDA